MASKVFSFLRYLWLDGTHPTARIRSKTRIIVTDPSIPSNKIIKRSAPDWGFDGSSTNQAPDSKEDFTSDRALKPVFTTIDPTRKNGFLVLCEVYKDDAPHWSNTRAKLVECNQEIIDHEVMVGFEQEYIFLRDRVLGIKGTGRVLGWPAQFEPGEQGPYYCGVGCDEVAGAEIVEEHAKACVEARLNIFGTNSEVMLGQWEFQIGPRGCAENSDPITISDHLIVARWLLYHIAAKHGVSVTLEPKPLETSKWNGSGLHTNFSTKETRDPQIGLRAIKDAISKLEIAHTETVSEEDAYYGAGISKRLTGACETASYEVFSHGIGDRTASIRIPTHVNDAGCGYFEDRRVCANADPYVVSRILVQTVCAKAGVVV